MPLASPNPDQGDKRFVVTLTGMPCSFSRIYAPELPPYEEMNPVQQAYYALEKLSEELRGKVAFTLGNVNSDFAFRTRNTTLTSVSQPMRFSIFHADNMSI